METLAKQAPAKKENGDTKADTAVKKVKTETPDKKHLVFVKHNGTDAVQTLGENGKKQYILKGHINGRPFEVPCDCQVEVTEDVYNALQNLLAAQENLA